MLWFCALRRDNWTRDFMLKILQGAAQTLTLFAVNPFPGSVFFSILFAYLWQIPLQVKSDLRSRLTPLQLRKRELKQGLGGKNLRMWDFMMKLWNSPMMGKDSIPSSWCRIDLSKKDTRRTKRSLFLRNRPTFFRWAHGMLINLVRQFQELTKINPLSGQEKHHLTDGWWDQGGLIWSYGRSDSIVLGFFLTNPGGPSDPTLRESFNRGHSIYQQIHRILSPRTHPTHNRHKYLPHHQHTPHVRF